jgi:nickel/cobalt transporter (NiCoT) family protein
MRPLAVVIGSVQLLSLLGDQSGLTGQPWDFLASIDSNLAGQFVVGTFFVWIGALIYYKVAKIE